MQRRVLFEGEPTATIDYSRVNFDKQTVVTQASDGSRFLVVFDPEDEGRLRQIYFGSGCASLVYAKYDSLLLLKETEDDEDIFVFDDVKEAINWLCEKKVAVS